VDFLCIPSILKATQNSVDIHNALMKSSLLFFNENIKAKRGFADFYNELVQSENITTEPFVFNKIKALNYTVFKSKVLDNKTGLPLAFVNIGVLNKEVGTVTNESGQFELKLNQELTNDSIRISMIGYKARSYKISNVLNHPPPIIKLEEEDKKLGEVVITAKNLKRKVIGNTTTTKFINTPLGSNQLGAEMGIKINIGKQPTFVDAFNFNVSYNSLNAKVLFRLNIYEIKNGKPSGNILTENVIIPIEPKQTGLISVNLKEYDIILNDDVIVTLEYVKNEGINNKMGSLLFSLGVLSGGTFVKYTSQGKLKKHRHMGVGFNLSVRY
jgi:hypothetical protein